MSSWIQGKREKFSNKETRWDRIRKKHTSSVNLKAENVRKFIEMDFIGKNNLKLLNGEENIKQKLNPLLVMNLRHEMFQKIPNKTLFAVATNRKNIDKCIVHNLEVEDNYIVNQLDKFREQLEKTRKRNAIKLNVENSLRLSNDGILQSLENSAQYIEDFYTAPIEAMTEANNIQGIDLQEDELFLTLNCRTPSTLSLSEEFVSLGEHSRCVTEGDDLQEDESLEPLNCSTHSKVPPGGHSRCVRFEDSVNVDANVTEGYNLQEDESFETLNCRTSIKVLSGERFRSVRFEESVDVVNFDRQESLCSNNSNDMESVISDLAEKALEEVEMDAKMALHIPSDSDHDQTGFYLQGCNLHSKKPDECLLIRKLTIPERTTEKEDNEISLSSIDSQRSSASSHEQNVIIEQLFQSRANNHIVILRKYFLKWIHYTTIEKIDKQNFMNKNDRIHKINKFLDNIRREKTRLAQSKSIEVTVDAKQSKTPVHIAKKYKNKIKIQQDIIDLQRLKIERQERMIMELKLNKLSDEAKEARLEIRNELKAAIRSGNAKVRAKAKCIQLIGNLRDEEDDEFARLQGKAMMMPKFLANMQERCLERSVKHEQAKQRRLQQKAEREAQKAAIEEAKRLQDEETKRMRIEMLKEKRRLEKMAKVIKERERQRAIENNKKSQEFCRKRLLRRIGIESFRRLLARKYDNQRKCEVFRRNLLKKTIFIAWKRHYIQICEIKIQRADDFHEKSTKRMALRTWIAYVRAERSKYLVAMDWHDLKLTESAFNRWCGYTKLQMMVEETKMRQATSHHEWHLKWKVIDRWQRLPQILKLEKETDERRQRWRMKIWELLPDYTPNRDAY